MAPQIYPKGSGIPKTPAVCAAKFILSDGLRGVLFCRFGEGYIITIRVQGDLPDLKPLFQFFSEKFPRASLKVGIHLMRVILFGKKKNRFLFADLEPSSVPRRV